MAQRMIAFLQEGGCRKQLENMAVEERATKTAHQSPVEGTLVLHEPRNLP